MTIELHHETRSDGEHWWFTVPSVPDGTPWVRGHLVGTEDEARAEAERRFHFITEGGTEPLPGGPCLVFAGQSYYPGGGMNDFVGWFIAPRGAIDSLSPRQFDWMQIVRADTLQVVHHLDAAGAHWCA